jgi:hypothetical protein
VYAGQWRHDRWRERSLTFLYPDAIKFAVIPAKAGTQSQEGRASLIWAPACAGMTGVVVGKPNDRST